MARTVRSRGSSRRSVRTPLNYGMYRIGAMAARRGANFIADRVASYARSGSSKGSKRTWTQRASTYRRPVANRFTSGRGPYKVRTPRRRAKVTMFDRQGAIWKGETGGAVTDANSVLVGHGTFCTQTVIQNMYRACIRYLMQLFDENMNSFNELALVGTYTFSYYSETDSVTQITYSHTVSVGQTYNDVAVSLWVLFLAEFGTSKLMIWNSMEFEDGFSKRARVSMKDVYIRQEMTSNIVIQNRTLANSGTMDPGTNNANDVSNNPLVGRVCSGKGTAIMFKDRTLGTSVANDLKINRIYGEVTRTGALMPDSNKIPLYGKAYIGDPTGRRVFLSPGQIKKHFLKSTMSMDFQTFFNKVYSAFKQQALTTTPNFPMVDLGKIGWFCFEKVLNSRVDEPNISVGYEVNYELKTCLAQRKTIVSPVVDIA